MTLTQLRTFLEVARTGSVRGAAAALVVTEPSVSAAVAALTKELGVRLVERRGRGIRLTDAGEELARHAAEILGLEDRARRAVVEAAGGPGLVRLTAVTTAGEYVLPPILAAFRAREPATEISLEVGNRATVVERLMAREADIGVGGRPMSGRLLGEAFLDNRLVVVARPDHPLKARRSFDPSLLSRETWLLREPGSGTRATTEELLRESGIDPEAITTIGSNGAIKEAAAVGLGVTLISMHAVVHDLRSGRLSHLKMRGTPLTRPWYALYRPGDTLPRSAGAFVEFLRSPAAAQAVRHAEAPSA